MYRAPSAAASDRCAGPAPTSTEPDGVDAVGPREGERKARERRPAPAARRPGGVRAEHGLERPRGRGGDAAGGGVEGRPVAVRVPVEHEARRVRGSLAKGVLPALAVKRARGDEHARLRSGRPSAHGRTLVVRRSRSPRPPPAARARAPRASATSARAGRAHAWRGPRSSSGPGSEPARSSRRSTRLTWACASGVSSQTHRTAAPCRPAASTTWLRAARVRYVLSRTTRRAPAVQRLVEGVCEDEERSSALVAVQAQVAAGRRAPPRSGSCPLPGSP